MNRREVIKALSGGIAGLPAVDEIQRLTLGPNDTLILRYECRLSLENMERLQAILQRELPGRKVLVLSDGAKLEVLRME